MRPKKRLGQHFLQDRSCARRIVNYLEIVDGDVVLEIGPGRGILTDCLMESPASEIIGVEVDPHLAVLLQHQYRQDHRFRLINEDFLKLGWDQLSSVRKIKVIGNLPYYITSPILFQLLSK